MDDATNLESRRRTEREARAKGMKHIVASRPGM